MNRAKLFPEFLPLLPGSTARFLPRVDLAKRAKAINAAVKLLSRPDDKWCAKNVENAMRKFDQMCADADQRQWTPRQNDKLVAAAKIARKLRSSLHELSPLWDDEFINEFVDQKKLQELIRMLDRLSTFKPGPKHKSSFRQRAAVELAALLLKKYGHRPAKTRQGKWDQLAVLLYGKPINSLYDPHILGSETE